MRLLAFGLAFYVLVIAGLTVFQRRFLYFPDRRLTHRPEAGMNGVEELQLATDDGKTLVAWYIPPREGRPLILYFHGNAGSLVDRAPRFSMVAASGYGQVLRGVARVGGRRR